MDFKDTPEEAAFRAELRAWLDAHARLRTADEHAAGGIVGMLAEAEDDDDVVEASKSWQRTLYEGGWAGITWPKAYGGREATAVQAHIFGEELSRYAVPPNLSAIGLGMIGPTLITHGTPAQKERYLRPMLSGEEIWCQLWSEPNAGSDVASLTTRADPADGEWVVNGQKVWTSGAHYSRFGLIITRTDPSVPKHRGITCFIVDMESPGIDVRALRQMTGGANFNEVFFTDVRVPAENLVGEVNDGWRVAMTTLMNERYSAMTGFSLDALMDPLLSLARSQVVDGSTLPSRLADQEMADAFIRAKLLTLTGCRSLTKISQGSIPGPEGSITKLVWSQLMSDIASLGLRFLGLRGIRRGGDAVDGGTWARGYLLAPGIHLGGGTDEIMRNIIGERVLGLPKEPQADKGVPFREVANRIGTRQPSATR